MMKMQVKMTWKGRKNSYALSHPKTIGASLHSLQFKAGLERPHDPSEWGWKERSNQLVHDD